MGQAQINVRTRACSRTSIARTKQAALTHNVRGKELMGAIILATVGPTISIPRFIGKTGSKDSYQRTCSFI